MLRQTFLHVPGVGYRTEERLWHSGITSWDDVATDRMMQVSPHLRGTLAEEIARSEAALRAGRYRYFALRLPAREHWRAWPEFRDAVAFLDIETTGLDIGRDALTVVGVYDGRRKRSFVRGTNLEELPSAVDRARLLVTFNGSRFDVPFLRRAFPRMRLDQIHLDLVHPLHRLGYWGGLKRIERRLGIERSDETAGMGGFDAVRLWAEYEAGDDDALDRLIAYNLEDVVNLEPLAEFAYASLRERALDRGFVTADVLDRERAQRGARRRDSLATRSGRPQ
ncbi:MAG TPA: ribonuclease H-like domain-containing protein [Thermoplasmata archaeon]|nr:ribonuclease H-like domain-containing protein [Thermoplasmata archaeon]